MLHSSSFNVSMGSSIRHPCAASPASQVIRLDRRSSKTTVICKVSQQLVQLEKAVLADMPTEKIVSLLQKHGKQQRAAKGR